VRITFEGDDGDEVQGGVAYVEPGPRIKIAIGRHTTGATLRADTTMVHEMAHLGFPDLDEKYLWLHEGIATYIETVASAQAGEMTPQAAWAVFARDLPEGLPGRNDKGGLDDTPSEDRRYWGGALYCLVADVEIRRRTNNRYGFREALRAILAAGGRLSETWKVERALAIGDKAVGVPVLSELFATWNNRSVTPDMDALWRGLGVQRSGRNMSLADTAPEAAIRRAITEPPAKPMLLVGPSLLRETVRQ
jgi:hypothetical protein